MPGASPLILPRSLRLEMEQHAVEAYPEECCGLLIGHYRPPPRRARRLVRMDNAAEVSVRPRFFEMDPARLRQVEREADAAGEALIGIYHSHPDHPARPSATDAERAWPFYSYVIVSVTARGPATLTSWRFDETTRRFEAEPISEASESV